MAARKMKSAAAYGAEARKAMRSLGVYKPEFESVVGVFGELREQYAVITAMFEASGYEYAEQTGAGSKKAPIVTTLEALRRDILAYASQLGLTPSGLLKADGAAFARKTAGGLAAALKELGEAPGP